MSMDPVRLCRSSHDSMVRTSRSVSYLMSLFCSENIVVAMHAPCFESRPPAWLPFLFCSLSPFFSGFHRPSRWFLTVSISCVLVPEVVSSPKSGFLVRCIKFNVVVPSYVFFSVFLHSLQEMPEQPLSFDSSNKLEASLDKVSHLSTAMPDARRRQHFCLILQRCRTRFQA